jgi:hypothetical protein
MSAARLRAAGPEPELATFQIMRNQSDLIERIGR